MGSDEKLGILVGFAIALAVAGFGGCSSNACFRNSDCASGESCSAGSCVIDTPAPASDASSASISRSVCTVLMRAMSLRICPIRAVFVNWPTAC